MAATTWSKGGNSARKDIILSVLEYAEAFRNMKNTVKMVDMLNKQLLISDNIFINSVLVFHQYTPIDIINKKYFNSMTRLSMILGTR